MDRDRYGNMLQDDDEDDDADEEDDPAGGNVEDEGQINEVPQHPPAMQ